MIQQNSKKIHTSNFITNRRLTFRYFQFCTNSLKLSHGMLNIEIQYWNSPIPHVEIVKDKSLMNVKTQKLLPIFAFKKWYFVTIIVLTYCEKKLF